MSLRGLRELILGEEEGNPVPEVPDSGPSPSPSPAAIKGARTADAEEEKVEEEEEEEEEGEEEFLSVDGDEAGDPEEFDVSLALASLSPGKNSMFEVGQKSVNLEADYEENHLSPRTRRALTQKFKQSNASQNFFENRELMQFKPKFLCITVKTKGVATILFILFFYALLFLFALLFCLVEAQAEVDRNEKYIELMNTIRLNTSEQVFQDLVNLIGVDPVRGTEHFVSYNGVGGWDKLDAQAFFSSYSYSFVLATTIGYGDIVTHTAAGKVLSALAVLITVPIAIVTYTRVADFLSNRAMRLLLKRSHEFQAVLRRYDADNSGALDSEELMRGLRDLGIYVTRSELDELLDGFDDDGNGVLDVDEFAKLATALNVKVGRVARNQLKLKFALVALILFFLLYIVIIAFAIQLNGLDAFYFTVITVFTVGLGDISPPQSVRPWLTIPTFFILGIMAVVIGSITEDLNPKTGRVYKENFSESDRTIASSKGPGEAVATIEMAAIGSRGNESARPTDSTASLSLGEETQKPSTEANECISNV